MKVVVREHKLNENQTVNLLNQERCATELRAKCTWQGQVLHKLFTLYSHHIFMNFRTCCHINVTVLLIAEKVVFRESRTKINYYF